MAEVVRKDSIDEYIVEYVGKLTKFIEELKKERDRQRESVIANRKQGFFTEADETEFYFLINQYRINALTEWLMYPAFLRIKAMTEPEIEEYKAFLASKLQVEQMELELKVKECEKEKTDLRDNNRKLTDDMKQMERGTTSYDQASRNIGSNSVQMSRLSREIGECERQIRLLGEQIETITKLTPEEVKSKIIAEKIKENAYTFEQYYQKGLKPEVQERNEIERAKEKIACDPQLADKYAAAVARFNYNFGQLGKLRLKVDTGLYLPDGLRKQLDKMLHGKEKSTPEQLIDYVKQYFSSYEQLVEDSRAFFDHDMLEEIYKQILEIEEHRPNVDLGLLRKHSDKISSTTIKNLEYMVEQRERNEKPIWKAFDKFVYGQPNDNNKEIKRQLESARDDLIEWYSKLLGKLGANFTIGEDGYALNGGTGNSVITDLDSFLKNIKELMNRLDLAKLVYDTARERYTSEMSAAKKDIEDIIKSVSGLSMETVTKGEYNDDERTVMHNLADVRTATKDTLAEAGMDWAAADLSIETKKILDAAKESSETDGNNPKGDAVRESSETDGNNPNGEAAGESSKTDEYYPKGEALDKLIDQLIAKYNTDSDIETLEDSSAKKH